jgi:hypothetical protein
VAEKKRSTEAQSGVAAEFVGKEQLKILEERKEHMPSLSLHHSITIQSWSCLPCDRILFLHMLGKTVHSFHSISIA